MDKILTLWRACRGSLTPIESNEILQLAAVSYSTLSHSPSTVGVTNPSTVGVTNPSTVGVTNPSTVGVTNPSTVGVTNPSTVGVTNPPTPTNPTPTPPPIEALTLLKQEGLTVFSARPGAIWALSMGALLYKRCIEPQDPLEHRRPGCMQLMQGLHRIATTLNYMEKSMPETTVAPPKVQDDKPLYHGLAYPRETPTLREQLEAYDPYEGLADRYATGSHS